MSEANGGGKARRGFENPYVGPRPFDEQDAARGRYHGREHEARDLLALVSRERLVLFYSQSGGGKSSLLRASLIPGLRQLGFDVLPIARVGGARSADEPGAMGTGEATNPFIYSVILSLDEGLPADMRATPEALLHSSLREYLVGEETEERAAIGMGSAHAGGQVVPAAANGAVAAGGSEIDAGEAMAPTVLLIDQFEEIVTVHSNRWQERRAFFEQLRDTMERLPRLWVVLTLREDYVAALEPYAELMPNRLRARYYMQRMGVEAALNAVRKPAENFHRPFAPGVAEKLVDNLRRVRVQFAGEPELGQYIEPVQLQIVCHELWEQVTRRMTHTSPPGSPECIIDEADLEVDYIDHSLTRFYQGALATTLTDAKVAAAGVDEQQLRTWFDKEIVTQGGIRNSVLRNEQTGFTGSLPNAAVDLLLERYLLRTELRAGGSWVELVHDRFVQPIVEDNAAWFPQHLSALQRQAALWQDEGREAGLLLQGDALHEAEQWAAAHPQEVKQVEQEFLQASLKEHKRQERARRQAQWIGWLALAAVLLCVVAFVTAYWALQAKNDAENSRLQSHKLAVSAQARQLASEAGRQLDDGEYETALLIAATSMTMAHNVDATTVLNMALAAPHIPYSLTYVRAAAGRPPELEWNGDQSRVLVTSTPNDETYMSTLDLFDASDGRLLLHLPSIRLAQWSNAKTRLLTVDEEGRIQIWDAVKGSELTEFSHRISRISSLAWNNDDSRVLTVAMAGPAIVWDAAKGTQVRQIDAAGQGFADATWNAAGDRILTLSSAGQVQVWHADGGKGIPLLPEASDGYADAGWSGDGRRLFTADHNGVVTLWDAWAGAMVRRFDSGGALAGSPEWTKDGLHFITRDENDGLQIWDMRTGKLLGNVAGVDGYELSSDDRWLLVYSISMRPITIWNVTTGEQLFIDKRFDTAAIDEGGKRLAALEGGSVRVYDMASRQEILLLPLSRRDAFSAEWLEDSNNLVTYHNDGSLQVWNGTNGKLLAKLAEEKGYYPALLQNSDGSRIVSADDTGAVRFWNASPEASTLQTTRNAVNGVWDRQKEHVLTWGRDGVVGLWDAASGRQMLELRTNDNSIKYASPSTDGTQILVRGAEATSVWDAASGQQIMRVPGVVSWCHETRVDEPWLSDGGLVGLVSEDRVLHIFDSRTGRELHTLRGVNACNWEKRGSKVAVWADRGPVRVFDGRTGAELATSDSAADSTYSWNRWKWNRSGTQLLLDSPFGAVLIDALSGADIINQDSSGIGDSPVAPGASFSATDAHVVARTSNAVEVRQANGGSLLESFPAGTGAAWSREGERIAIAQSEGTVLVWDIASGKRMTLPGHAKANREMSYHDMQWSKDGRRLLTSDGDGVLRVWETDSGNLIQTYPNPAAADTFPMLDSTGRMLILYGTTDYIFWDVDTKQELLRIDNNSANIVVVPDDNDTWQRLLIINNGAVSIVPTDPARMRDEACALTPRNLSWEEWGRILPNDPYAPACPGKLLPPDVIAAVKRKAGDLVQAGKGDEAKQLVDELNGWLRASNQFEQWGVTLDTEVPEQQAGEN